MNLEVFGFVGRMATIPLDVKVRLNLFMNENFDFEIIKIILGESEPFMSWVDPEPFNIGHIGVCTGWGACGNWVIEAPQPGMGNYQLYTFKLLI